jgi:hypothetical protein
MWSWWLQYPAQRAILHANMSDKHDKDPKRDKWADREADKDRDPADKSHPSPPSGNLGPGGSALDHLKDEAMESDPPDED